MPDGRQPLAVGCGLVVGEAVGEGCAPSSAMAFYRTAIVAASTVPVTFTPKSFCSFSGAKGELVGPHPVVRTVPVAGELERLLHSRRRRRLLLLGPAALGGELGAQRLLGRLVEVPVWGRPLAFCSASTAATSFGP